MQCKSPERVTRKGLNGYMERIDVPCGRCVFCLSKRRNDWTFRINQELKVSFSAYFVTLTYADKNVPLTGQGIPTLDKRHVQLFLKRIRAKQESFVSDPSKLKQFDPCTLKSKIRYYMVGEYGSRTNRPHYHLIMFNLLKDVAECIPGIWNMGYTQVGTVGMASIHYVTKYMITKSDFPTGAVKPFSEMSKGLGKSYLSEAMVKYHLENQNFTVRNDKHFQAMPRYYKDKIFNQYEKDEFRLQTLGRIAEADAREIKRVSDLGNDPHTYQDNRIKDLERTIRQKVTKNNKI